MPNTLCAARTGAKAHRSLPGPLDCLRGVDTVPDGADVVPGETVLQNVPDRAGAPETDADGGDGVAAHEDDRE